jgi:integrase
MRTLRTVFNTARRIDETIGQNPVDAIRIPARNRREVEPIDMPEWWAGTSLLALIRRDLHRFLMFTGLRKTSAITIARGDVNLDAAMIRVRHMKSGRPFILPLSDFLVTMLRERMEEDAPLGSAWLWPGRNSASGHVVEPWCDGLPSSHVYRHLYRTFAIAAGVPFAESALLLDHRLPGATGGYVHAEHLAIHLRLHQQRLGVIYVRSHGAPDIVPR